jgi:tetratricopeptide (TPR) repeat protein
MEGYGFFSATHANQQVDALIVRGISDLIDKKSRDDAANSQEIAARHASAFAFEVLANLCDEGQASVSQKKTQSASETLPPQPASKGTGNQVTFQNAGPIHAPFQIGNQNTINNFVSPTNEVEDGTTHLVRGHITLSYGDYTTARQHLAKAARLLSEAQVPEENAQAKYLLALAYLSGEQPFGVSIDVWERVEELLRAAMRLNPCYSYLYAFALFELDFSRHGWKKAQYIREAQRLMQEANNLPRIAIDEENIDLLWKCQQRLMQEMRNPEE